MAHDFIEVNADLHPLAMLTAEPRYQRLGHGAPVTDVLTGFDDDLLRDRGIPDDAIVDAAWLLAPDALQGWAAGDPLGVTVRPDGFELGAAIPGQAPADLAERLTAAIAEEGQHAPAMLDRVMWELCADDPTLFATPLSPLGELLAEHEFIQDGDQLAPPGFDLPGWRAVRQTESIQRLHGIDRDAALAVLVLKRLHEDASTLLEVATDTPDPFGRPCSSRPGP